MRSLDTPFLRILAVVFGGSLAVQLFAFLRQLIIASAFGIDRAMDLYLLVFAVATVTAFAIGSVIENAAVPMLVARRDERDEKGFGEIANRVLVLSAILAILSACLFAAGVPLFARFVATGLSDADRSGMHWLIVWFLPWVLIATPYYALGSLHKAKGQFRRFMTAEVLVTIVSLSVVWAWRPGVNAIALAYAAGYAAGFLAMLPGSGLNLRARPFLGEAGRGIRRQMFRLLATNQIGALGMLADRFLISQTPPGVIAAGSYATLISGQVGALLGFRDAFMVPLSSPEGRTEKLERMIIGLLLLSVPIAVFLWWQAVPVVSVLLERGRFDRSAVEITAMMLSYYAAALPASAVMLPMYRTLQILDRMRFAGYLLLGNAAVLFGSGLVLVLWLGLGVRGYLLAVLASSYAGLAFVWLLLRFAGVRLGLLRVTGYALYAVCASMAAVLIGGAVLPAGPPLWEGIAAGALFAVVYSAGLAAIGGKLKRIIRDVGEGDLKPAPTSAMRGGDH